MAAIIAQITREARARKIRIKRTLPIYRSNYVLPPFKDHFDPSRDNKYLMEKYLFEKREKIKARIDEIVSQEKAKQEEQDSVVTFCQVLSDILILLLSFSFVPFLAFLVVYIWPDFENQDLT